MQDCVYCQPCPVWPLSYCNINIRIKKCHLKFIFLHPTDSTLIIMQECVYCQSCPVWPLSLCRHHAAHFYGGVYYAFLWLLLKYDDDNLNYYCSQYAILLAGCLPKMAVGGLFLTLPPASSIAGLKCHYIFEGATFNFNL